MRNRLLTVALAALPLAAPARAFQDAAPKLLTPAESFEKKLASHRYFKKVELNRVEDHAPFVFWIQRVANEVPTYKTNVAREYGPWLIELRRLLERDVFGADAPAPAGALLPVIVLSTRGDYSNYLQVSGGRGLYGTSANHDEKLDAVIAFQDTFGGGGPAFRRRLPALRKGVHMLLTQRSPLKRPAPEVWLTEGLAGYLSFHLGAKPEDLAKRPFDRSPISELYSIRRSQERTDSYWMSLAEMIAVRGDKALRELPRKRLGESVKRSGSARLYETFDTLTQLWVRFLMESHQGRYRAGFAGYVELALADEGGAAVLVEALNVKGLAELEVEFRTWVDGVFAEVLKVEITTGVAATPPAGAAAQGAPEEDIWAFEPTELEVELDEPARALGYGLWMARTGDLTRACELLERAVEVCEEDSQERARAARALGRAEWLRTARDAYLAELTAAKGKLRVTVDGRKINVTADRIEDGVLHFAAARDGIERVRVDRIAAGDLALAMGKRTAEFGPALLRAWGMALGGNDKWKRYAREGEGADALVTDVESDLERLLAIGEAIARLNDLAAKALPESDADARDILDAILALKADRGGVGVVLSYGDELAAFAAAALGVRFDHLGLEGALEGGVEHLEDGAIRVTYSFDRAEELNDFERDPELLAYRRGRAPLVKYTGDPSIEVDGGRVELAGAVALVHRLRFSAPSKMRVDFSYGWPTPGVDGAVRVLFGLALTTETRYVACWAFDRLEVWWGSLEDSGTNESRVMDPDHVYSGELHLEGADDVSLWLDGKRLRGQKARGNAAGKSFLWYHADFPNWVEGVVLEGVPTAASVADLRASWVADQLAELKLD